MQLPQCISRRLPFRARFVAEGVELEDRNDPPTQSARSQDIEQEIKSGTAMCSICTDPVALGPDSLSNIWDCKDCYSVFHYQCVKSWETHSKKNNSHVIAWFGTSSWRCPNCSAPQDIIQGRKCWCRKQSHLLCEIDNPNACGYVCARKGKCAHGREKSCSQICHPGPCMYPCTADCPPGPVLAPKPPNALDRMRKRFRGSKTGSVKNLVGPWIVFLVAYGLLAVLLTYHIRWHTELYRWPNINRASEGLGVFLGLVVIFIPLNLFLVAILFLVTVDSLCSILNLNPAEGRREPGKLLLRTLLRLLLFFVFVGLFLLPYVGFGIGPDLKWRHLMKNSCEGMDTRIMMDRESGVPATWFKEERIRGGRRHRVGGGWYLGQHVKPASTPSDKQPFQYYSRLSGKLDRQNIAIDVDISKNVWRLMHLNGSDSVNAWLAYESKKLVNDEIQGLSSINVPGETLVKNGTFNIPSLYHSRDNYWQGTGIPELDINIWSMSKFLTDPTYEPFLRVFNWQGYDYNKTAEDQGEAKLDEDWTRRPHDREIMRMAAFGEGRSDLTLCVRDYAEYRDGKAVAPAEPGMNEETVVPFAIIAALRQRYIETEKRSKWSTYSRRKNS
ncbi:hypothetical protein VTL71DRAFT_16557 [Oculimacula yallundae]|uniref:RING-type domain-containing protein n=1 Tax=Oculimacula yallundae TaxID=86028 RepID=A0ABR4CES7_9HELO